MAKKALKFEDMSKGQGGSKSTSLSPNLLTSDWVFSSWTSGWSLLNLLTGSNIPRSHWSAKLQEPLRRVFAFFFPLSKLQNCLVVWNMNGLFFHEFITFRSVGNVVIPTDEVIFFRMIHLHPSWVVSEVIPDDVWKFLSRMTHGNAELTNTNGDLTNVNSCLSH